MLTHRYEKGTEIVAEERALLCATVGTFRLRRPKTTIVAKEMYVSSATMFYAIGSHPEVYQGHTMKFIRAHPEVTKAPLISRITTLRINTLMFEIN